MLQLRKPAVFQGHRALVLLPLCLFLCLCYVPTVFSFLPSSSLGWGCASCNQSSCPPVACNESLQYMDGCGCCILCAKLEGERCGGEGDAGGRCNGSGLRCAYRLGSILGESRMGVCENERCRRKDCGYRERCRVVIEEHGRVERHCTCDYFHCEHKWKPLCGRDGRNYASVCELRKKECLLGTPIGIQHFNKCKVVEWSPPDPISLRKTNNVVLSHHGPTPCLYEEVRYNPLDSLPPTHHNPCTYHVCSDHGDMVQYPVLGCEGNPPEEDYRVEDVVTPAAWSSWSPYSFCYGNCQDAGWKNRSRTCTNPPPSLNPEAVAAVLRCEGESSERKLCEPLSCTICNYTSWSEWSRCSTTALCREGSRTRTRTLKEEPTVPELCVTKETKKCQLLACANCSRAWSDTFNIRKKLNECKSLYGQPAYVCGGSCGDGKCCRDIFRDNDRLPDLSFELLCPDGSVRVASFEQAGYCECRDCDDPYEKPGFMRSSWEIIY